jgi:hypothetical protein
MCTCWRVAVAIVHLVQLGLERGLDKDGASSLLLYLSIGSIVCRLPLAYVADHHPWSLMTWWRDDMIT